MGAVSSQRSVVSSCRTHRLRTTIVHGRQTIERVERTGIFFIRVGRYLRSVYCQMDGTTVLADECNCRVEWPERTLGSFTFAIMRDLNCPIDEHKLLARTEEDAA